MRALIVKTFMTHDGVMQAPGGSEEDPSGGFDHGGWSFGYWDEQMGTALGESMSEPFDLVLGRKTYATLPLIANATVPFLARPVNGHKRRPVRSPCEGTLGELTSWGRGLTTGRSATGCGRSSGN
jgi:hypothetical protein